MLLFKEVHILKVTLLKQLLSLQDGSDNGVDLSGGYFTDGDGYVKYNLPLAASATVLAWSVIRYERTYNKLNELQNVQNYAESDG